MFQYSKQLRSNVIASGIEYQTLAADKRLVICVLFSIGSMMKD